AEAQTRYIMDALKVMDQQEVVSVDVRADAQAAYLEELKRRSVGTVWFSGCASWYIDANGRNSTVWPGFTFDYRRRVATFDASNYNLQGEGLRGARVRTPVPA